MSASTDGGERHQVPVELKLQVVRHPAWVLGVEHRFCVKQCMPFTAEHLFSTKEVVLMELLIGEDCQNEQVNSGRFRMKTIWSDRSFSNRSMNPAIKQFFKC